MNPLLKNLQILEKIYLQLKILIKVIQLRKKKNKTYNKLILNIKMTFLIYSKICH
jgi:hypothetical protein